MRAFPVIYTTDVRRLVAFYGRLGFEVVYRFPPETDDGYASLRRGASELGIVDASAPRDLAGVDIGPGPRFEMFVYVEDLEASIAAAGAPVLREPRDMPWGERLAYITDPDGNPVALAESR